MDEMHLNAAKRYATIMLMWCANCG